MLETALTATAKSLRPYSQHTPLMATREGIDSPEVIKATEVLAGRTAYPEEIADLVGMLCSHESGWRTGSVVNTNGGMLKQL